MCDPTKFISDYRAADIRRADRYTLWHIRQNRALLSAPLKVFRAALGFGSDQAARNAVARLSRCLSGEIGALAITEEGEQLLPLAAPVPAAREAAQPETPRESTPYSFDNPAYKAGYVAGQRSIRRSAKADSDFTGVSQKCTEECTTDAQRETPHVHARAGSGIRFIYKSGIRSGPESGLYINPESGPVPDSGTGVKLLPPKSVTERFVEVGMTQEKAAARVAEFGEERCLDALEALDCERARSEIKSPAGYLANFLIKARPLPPALLKQREAAKQGAMTMLQIESVIGVDQQPAKGEPCACPPPKEMLNALRGTLSVKRLPECRTEAGRDDPMPRYASPSAEEMARREFLARQAEELSRRREAA